MSHVAAFFLWQCSKASCDRSSPPRSLSTRGIVSAPRRIVTAWRQWLEGKGSPGWVAGSEAPPAGLLPKAQLLDRYEQHTKHCPHCLRVHLTSLAHTIAGPIPCTAAASFCMAYLLFLTMSLLSDVPAIFRCGLSESSHFTSSLLF